MPAGLYELEDMKVAIRNQDATRMDQILADRNEGGIPLVLDREEDHKNLLTWFFKEINHWYDQNNWPLLLKLLAVHDNQGHFIIQIDHTDDDSNPLHQILSKTLTLLHFMEDRLRHALRLSQSEADSVVALREELGILTIQLNELEKKGRANLGDIEEISSNITAISKAIKEKSKNIGAIGEDIYEKIEDLQKNLPESGVRCEYLREIRKLRGPDKFNQAVRTIQEKARHTWESLFHTCVAAGPDKHCIVLLIGSFMPEHGLAELNRVICGKAPLDCIGTENKAYRDALLNSLEFFSDKAPPDHIATENPTYRDYLESLGARSACEGNFDKMLQSQDDYAVRGAVEAAICANNIPRLQEILRALDAAITAGNINTDNVNSELTRCLLKVVFLNTKEGRERMLDAVLALLQGKNTAGHSWIRSEITLEGVEWLAGTRYEQCEKCNLNHTVSLLLSNLIATTKEFLHPFLKALYQREEVTSEGTRYCQPPLVFSMHVGVAVPGDGFIKQHQEIIEFVLSMKNAHEQPALNINDIYEGETLLDRAIALGDEEVVALLKKYGGLTAMELREVQYTAEDLKIAMRWPRKTGQRFEKHGRSSPNKRRIYYAKNETQTNSCIKSESGHCSHYRKINHFTNCESP